MIDYISFWFKVKPLNEGGLVAQYAINGVKSKTLMRGVCLVGFTTLVVGYSVSPPCRHRECRTGGLIIYTLWFFIPGSPINEGDRTSDVTFLRLLRWDSFLEGWLLVWFSTAFGRREEKRDGCGDIHGIMVVVT